MCPFHRGSAHHSVSPTQCPLWVESARSSGSKRSQSQRGHKDAEAQHPDRARDAEPKQAAVRWNRPRPARQATFAPSIKKQAESAKDAPAGEQSFCGRSRPHGQVFASARNVCNGSKGGRRFGWKADISGSTATLLLVARPWSSNREDELSLALPCGRSVRHRALGETDETARHCGRPIRPHTSSTALGDTLRIHQMPVTPLSST
jgi:hypothetical protein